jgi:hypothetical protein
MDEKADGDWFKREYSGRFRFVARRPDGMHSSMWAAWANKSDYYVVKPAVGAAMKISLHPEGGFRLAHTASFARRVGKSVVDRAIVVWPKPEIGESGAKHVLSIVLPIGGYMHVAPQERLRKAVWSYPVPANWDAAEIGFFYHRDPYEEMVDRFRRVGLPVFAASLDNGETVSMVVRPCRLGAVAVSGSLGEGRSRFGVLLFDDPKPGEALIITDIGGISAGEGNSITISREA